jgi:predicted nucleotidyltransferase
MIDLIEYNRQAIEDLCRQYGVRRLAVFGSAAKGTFDPATSDLDFVVEMADYGPGVAMRFLSFGVALEDRPKRRPRHGTKHQEAMVPRRSGLHRRDPLQ